MRTVQRHRSALSPGSPCRVRPAFPASCEPWVRLGPVRRPVAHWHRGHGPGWWRRSHVSHAPGSAPTRRASRRPLPANDLPSLDGPRAATKWRHRARRGRGQGASLLPWLCHVPGPAPGRRGRCHRANRAKPLRPVARRESPSSGHRQLAPTRVTRSRPRSPPLRQRWTPYRRPLSAKLGWKGQILVEPAWEGSRTHRRLRGCKCRVAVATPPLPPLWRHASPPRDALLHLLWCRVVPPAGADGAGTRCAMRRQAPLSGGSVPHCSPTRGAETAVAMSTCGGARSGPQRLLGRVRARGDRGSYPPAATTQRRLPKT